MYVCMYVCVYACMYVCMYVRMYGELKYLTERDAHGARPSSGELGRARASSGELKIDAHGRARASSGELGRVKSMLTDELARARSSSSVSSYSTRRARPSSPELVREQLF
eukprot:NODE_1883_length_874_cov_3.195152_g1313_i0.p1 GENE.NODE_1883_length_874_cov_3.195152_g1313_i0~~NODE_1883_length_874_cov_3.195152_g1313_i0.p1  ORF type:complete len:110 (+),score=11.08 NODE_1883_length_874_cov_3.195152_g1313_i0:3-332(+)